MQQQQTILFSRTYTVIKNPLCEHITHFYITPGSTRGVPYKQVFIGKCSDNKWRIGFQTIPDEKHKTQLYILSNIIVNKTKFMNFLAPYANEDKPADFNQQKRNLRFMIENAVILEHVAKDIKLWEKGIAYDEYRVPNVPIELIPSDDLERRANAYAALRNNGMVNNARVVKPIKPIIPKKVNGQY